MHHERKEEKLLLLMRGHVQIYIHNVYNLSLLTKETQGKLLKAKNIKRKINIIKIVVLYVRHPHKLDCED